MPCDGSGYPDTTRAELNRLAPLLCEACKLLERHSIPVSIRLAAWWDEHKEIDRKREQRERQEAEQEAKRKDALSKLTPAERKLLGIR